MHFSSLLVDTQVWNTYQGNERPRGNGDLSTDTEILIGLQSDARRALRNFADAAVFPDVTERCLGQADHVAMDRVKDCSDRLIDSSGLACKAKHQ